MAKVRIEEDDSEWAVGIKKGDGIEKYWEVTVNLANDTYDEILFNQYNLKLWLYYFLILIVAAFLCVFTVKCLRLFNTVRETQDKLMRDKFSSNKRKQE